MRRAAPAAARAALLWLAAFLLALSPGLALAQESEQTARAIARELQCPVCQNLSVADSSSQLAQQMRELIQRKIEAGESREAILAYFVERYGEGILLDPPKRGFNLLIWAGPPLALALGGAVVATALARWRRASPMVPVPPALDPDETVRYRERLRRDLAGIEPGGVDTP